MIYADILDFDGAIINEYYNDDDPSHSFEMRYFNNVSFAQASGHHCLNTSEIKRLDAEPTGCGGGTEAYLILERYLKYRGVDTIYLYSVRAASRFWLRMGFIPEECPMGDFVCGNMIKKLS